MDMVEGKGVEVGGPGRAEARTKGAFVRSAPRRSVSAMSFGIKAAAIKRPKAGANGGIGTKMEPR